MLMLLCRRFAGLILTLLIVSLVIFAVMSWLPGDPAAIMLGTSATPETLAALRHQLGFDEPMILRYGHWLIGALSGDLGQSYTYGVPVSGLIIERLALTLPLALIAIVLSMAVGIPLGVLAASRRHPGLLGRAFAHPALCDDAWLDAGRWISRLGGWFAAGLACPCAARHCACSAAGRGADARDAGGDAGYSAG
jgi:hypothetical protein